MGDLIHVESADGQPAYAPIVYHRATWNDPWTVIPYCYARSASMTTGNAISRAEIVYEYGELLQPDEASFKSFAPLDILGNWVKIEWTMHTPGLNYDFITDDRLSLIGVDIGQQVLQGDSIYVFNGPLGFESVDGNWGAVAEDPTTTTQAWYGVATDQVLSHHASNDEPGTQTITCMGPEWLLSRIQVTKGLVDDTAAEYETKSGLTFNPLSVGRSSAITGNRGGLLASGSYGFAATVNDASETWTRQTAVEYLLKNFPPVSSSAVTWLMDATITTLLDKLSDPQNVPTHGRTLFDLMNQLVPRSLGVVWWIEVDDASNTFIIRGDSMSSTDITLPISGETVNKNIRLRSLSYLDAAVVRTATLYTSTQDRYEQVTVEGARRGSVCTLRLKGVDDTDGFSEDWSSANKTSYDIAASNIAGYVSLGTEEQGKLNDRLRNDDATLSQVYASFKLDTTWAGLGLNDQVVNPAIDDKTAEIDTPLVAQSGLWVNGVRLEPYTPLRNGYDYTLPTAPVRQIPINLEAEQAKPFVGIKVEPTQTGMFEDYKFSKSDQLYELHDDERLKGGSPSNFRLAVYQSTPGFRLVSNAPNHMLALNQFSGASSSTKPIFDYRQAFATVYITFPDRIAVTVPDVVPGQVHDDTSTLMIRLGDRAHFDYMPSGTVYGIDEDGTVLQSTSAGPVRDDRQLMRDLAEMAYSWNATTKNAINLVFGQLSSQAQIGRLIEVVNVSTVINAVVSFVGWDFERQTTEVRTDFAELDFARFVSAQRR